jgi:hypothetical protein
MPVMDEKVKFAIHTSWIDFNIMPIKNGWQSLGGIYKTASYTPFYFISMKLGVLGSYNFYEKNYVDVYFNYNPTLSIAGSLYNYHAGDYNFSTSGSGFGNRFSTGINYRILVFNVGAEFILGHIKYNGNVNISDSQSSSIISYNNFTTKFNTNTLRFKIGYSF